MNTPTDEQVKSYIKSVPGLRQTWGIPKAKSMGTVALALMCLLLMGVLVGAAAYFMRVDTSIPSSTPTASSSCSCWRTS